MKNNSHLTRVMIYQNLGFLCIMVLCFLDDILKLPQWIFSDHSFDFVFKRTTLEILLIFGVWFLVSSSTRRSLERIQYLEKFMRLCAWCRKINFKGDWITMEQFMEQGFDTPTTHGICPCCLDKQKAAAEKIKEARRLKKAEAEAEAAAAAKKSA
jgi:hypothetical protein